MTSAPTLDAFQTKNGRLVDKTNSIVTFALEKSGTAWHINGWSWADG